MTTNRRKLATTAMKLINTLLGCKRPSKKAIAKHVRGVKSGVPKGDVPTAEATRRRANNWKEKAAQKWAERQNAQALSVD